MVRERDLTLRVLYSGMESAVLVCTLIAAFNTDQYDDSYNGDVDADDFGD